MKKDDIYKACSILATMFTILGISLFNISPIMFLVIISVCIVVIIIELIKIYLEYKRRLNKAKKIQK